MEAVTKNGDAQALANHIRSIPGFAFATFDVPYRHMGATLVDAVLQAGVNYATLVVPRVQRLLRDYPDAVTTSEFARLLREVDPHVLLRWKGPRRIAVLHSLTGLLVAEGVESEADMLAFLDRPGSKSVVMGIKGVKSKTFAYLRFLAGAGDAVAVDRHMRRLLQDAGIEAPSFDEAQQVYGEAALLLGVTPATLEYSVFLHGSSGARRRR